MDLELRNLATGSLPMVCSAPSMEAEVVSLHFPKESCERGKCVLYPLLLLFLKQAFNVIFFHH